MTPPDLIATRPSPAPRDLPSRWLSPPVKSYLDHTYGGVGIRALARQKGCHASTISRQVRKIEALRDDQLVDEALDHFGGRLYPALFFPGQTKEVPMRTAPKSDISEARITREARRILRRLCESGAFLLLGDNMPKAVVMREVPPQKPVRIAVMDRDVAYAFALNEWITLEKKSRVSTYRVTSVGRSALKRLLEEERKVRGMAEAQSAFLAQHQMPGTRVVENGGKAETIRINLAESPLSALGRKVDKDGVPFLSAELIAAGERFRDAYEAAQMGPKITQNWDRFLTAGRSGFGGISPADGPADARRQFAEAMEALGPGLSDIALRCCCYLEGLEAAEKRLGWSARSGKVVLRIALQRLAQHYGIRVLQAAS
ncbi:DUF6456 domain-containing protein [Paracoccaceae bacterium GXU_MW_L88]